MSCSVVVRGNAVTFTAVFYTAAGAVATPASARVYLVYDVSGVSTAADYALVQSGSEWAYTWESSVADAGVVYWSVRSVTPSTAEDGSLTLSANVANP